MNLRITLLAFLCLCATAILRAERVDMLKAGAKANGKALNTKLINSSIDRLNREGGGTLFSRRSHDEKFPAVNLCG